MTNRDVDALIDAFRELHEVERVTGRAGLSARVRLSIMNLKLPMKGAGGD